MNVFLDDVLNQTQAMRDAMACYKDYTSAFERLSSIKPQNVLFTGMGSSHYCSQPAVIRLIQGGMAARVEAASEVLYYERQAITPDTLLIITSQSGESGEIVSLLERLPASQTIVGITNDPRSTLGRRADICLEMRVAPELAVSTRTYLASLILSDMVASALLGESVQDSLRKSAEAVGVLEAFLADHEALQQEIARFFDHPQTLCYIGRGPALATAECGALFTRETAKYPALAFDSGEFRHGPYEMVDEKFCAMIFAPGGATMELQMHLTDAIAEHGGRVVFVTDADVRFDSARVKVLRHLPVAENHATLIEIAAAQLFANDMALHLGHAPGVFRQSSKVTTAQ